MSYSRKEEFFSEICSRIDDMIGVNKKTIKKIIRGETKEVTEISSKYNAYDKGDSVIFSFDELNDYERVMKELRNSSRMMTYDDNYLEFRFQIA